MPDPGDIIGQAVVNVRTCVWADIGNGDRADWCEHYKGTASACSGCQGDGTWLDTSEATEVERLGCEDCKPLWRPVENGDTDDVG